MRATNRIYMLLGRRPEQVRDITPQFFDLNIEHTVEQVGLIYYRVTGAGGVACYKAFAGPQGEGKHEVLGMRMLLHKNTWYVCTDDVDLNISYIQAPPPPWGHGAMIVVVAGLFALFLLVTGNHILRFHFTWQMYEAWIITVLLWASFHELRENRK